MTDILLKFSQPTLSFSFHSKNHCLFFLVPQFLTAHQYRKSLSNQEKKLLMDEMWHFSWSMLMRFSYWTALSAVWGRWNNFYRPFQYKQCPSQKLAVACRCLRDVSVQKVVLAITMLQLAPDHPDFSHYIIKIPSVLCITLIEGSHHMWCAHLALLLLT